MGTVSYTRRVNLGDYEHAEANVTFDAEDIAAGLEKAKTIVHTFLRVKVQEIEMGAATPKEMADNVAQQAEDHKPVRVTAKRLKEFKDLVGDVDDDEAKEFIKAAGGDVEQAAKNYVDVNNAAAGDPDAGEDIDDLLGGDEEVEEDGSDIDDLIGGDEPEEEPIPTEEELMKAFKAKSVELQGRASTVLKGILKQFGVAQLRAVPEENRLAFFKAVEAAS